jgi:hypothetical protein
MNTDELTAMCSMLFDMKCPRCRARFVVVPSWDGPDASVTGAIIENVHIDLNCKGCALRVECKVLA